MTDDDRETFDEIATHLRRDPAWYVSIMLIENYAKRTSHPSLGIDRAYDNMLADRNRMHDDGFDGVW